MAARWLLVPALTALTLTAWPVPARAQGGHVHLVVQVVNPIFDDSDQVVFEVQVTNLGPNTATHIETERTVLLCATPTTPLTGCQNTAPQVLQIRDLRAGEHDIFPTAITVPESGAVTIRTNVQVVRVDQHDDLSVPGTCDYGQVPQDDCGTNVLTLSP
ncbi:MAG TPA: hypothetical protein VFX70_00870 [Mycobacteriales bacterium]|nr:hypothetical protein [Mycobacteriales bacterium]